MERGEMSDHAKGRLAYEHALDYCPGELHSAEQAVRERLEREWEPENVGLFRIGWRTARQERE